MKRLLPAFSAAFCLAFGCGGGAVAATFVFNVSVERQLDAAGPVTSFTPFGFQQAWNISSNPQTIYGHSGTGSVSLNQFDAGSAVAGYSPITAHIMDIVDISGPHESEYMALKRFSQYGTPDVAGTLSFSLGDEVRTSVDLGDGKFLKKYHIRQLFFDGPFQDEDYGILDQAGLTRMLSQAGTFTWVEWGQAAIHDTRLDSYQTVAQIQYFGTATFGGVATPVPEPATWALFIVGFGAIGSYLRRPGRSPSSAR